MHTTTAQNLQHKLDQATGAWTANGRGSRRVHRSYAGWELRQVANRQGRWTIHRPDGSLLRHVPWADQSVHSLTAAKAIADEAGARG